MEKGALKIAVSQENVTLSFRENPYTKEQSEKGFLLDLASTVRNETSPFTYLKSLNCGENILEKRAARRRGMDEPVFINTKGQLAEGATTNLFFGKNRFEDIAFSSRTLCSMLTEEYEKCSQNSRFLL